MSRTSSSRIRLSPVLAAVALGLAAAACGGRGWNPNAPTSGGEPTAAAAERPRTAAETVAAFRAKDPTLATYFDECAGYVVFPTVGKGGFWVGGAYGKGDVYRSDALIGHASITQLTAGPQIGGQVYSEIIFFKDDARLRDFTAGRFELGAQVSAVAIDEGASHNAAYDDGVAVFTLTHEGLMAEATVAGQKFDFRPVAAER
jgi:lipid-binding SYLF domain-containing protein